VRLTGAQKRSLDEAIRDAYRNYSSLERMLAYQLDRRLGDIAPPSGMKDVVFRLLESAEAEGWLDEAATAALIANPGNSSLRQLYQQGVFHPGPVVRQLLEDGRDEAAETLLPGASTLADLPPRQELESLLKTAVGFLDVVPWATKLLEEASRVCRIEVDTTTGMEFGTGFLIGPDLVLTNHHVVASVINGGDPAGVKVQFDYQVIRAGSIYDGKVSRLAEDWWVASSPPSAVDLQVNPLKLPTSDELDVAVVRLDAPRGNDAVVGRGQRGWLDLTAPPPPIVAGLPLAILQHPNRLPVKVALDTEGVIAANANQTRVTYRTNTLPGSSGAPCFSLDLKLVALHHAGEPTYGAGRNEGVPIAAIVSYLERQGLVGALDG
jgi:hypothetical protein